MKITRKPGGAEDQVRERAGQSMFIAGAYIICKVVDGRKMKKQKAVPPIIEVETEYENQDMSEK